MIGVADNSLREWIVSKLILHLEKEVHHRQLAKQTIIDAEEKIKIKQKKK